MTLPPDYIDANIKGVDKEMLETFYTACLGEGGTADEVHLRGLRAVLARYGTAHPAPVPVGERLPDRSDCDSEGRCWWLMESVEGFAPPTWALGTYRIKQGTWKQTHWLPHWALPLPEAQP